MYFDPFDDETTFTVIHDKVYVLIMNQTALLSDGVNNGEGEGRRLSSPVVDDDPSQRRRILSVRSLFSRGDRRRLEDPILKEGPLAVTSARIVEELTRLDEAGKQTAAWEATGGLVLAQAVRKAKAVLEAVRLAAEQW